MKIRLGFVVLLLLVAGPAFADDIRVMWHPRDYWGEGNTPVNQSGTMYIFGMVVSSSSDLAGAEFRVDGFPSDWIASVPSPAANYVNGGPLQGGCQIAFPACQSANDLGLVLLYTVEYVATSTVANRTISIWAHSTPSNPNFPCSVIVQCDPPVYTKICVAGVSSMLNRTIAIEDRSWSHFKALYE